MPRPLVPIRPAFLLACLANLLLVAAHSRLAAAQSRSVINDGIRMTAEATGKFQYADDFSTPKFLADAFPENLTAEQWQEGRITNSGPHVRTLTYRFYADRLIQQFSAQVEQSANTQLGGVNILYVSANGLDWAPAANSGSQKADAGGSQQNPLSLSTEQAAKFVGGSEVWVRLVLSNGSGLKTGTSNTISQIRITAMLGDKPVNTDPQAALRADWDKLRQATGRRSISLDRSDPVELRAPHYYEDSDGYLREPRASLDLRPEESQGFPIQRAYMGWSVPSKDLNPPRRPAPSRYPLSLAMFVNVEAAGGPLLAQITVRRLKNSSRQVNVLWDGKPVGNFDSASYIEEEKQFFFRVPDPQKAGIHELRLAGVDRGAILVHQIGLAGSGLSWAKKPPLPDGGILEVLSAYYMPDPAPPVDSQAVEGRPGSKQAGLVFKGLQKVYQEHGDFGGLRVVLRNNGTVPVRIRELLLNDKPVEESYVDFVKDDWDARGVVWYRIRPATMLPGECGQVYLRFRRRPAGEHAALTVNLENGKAICIDVPFQDPALVVDYVTSGKTGDVLYTYLRRSPGSEPGAIESLSLDGVSLQEYKIYGADFPGNVALVVAKLPLSLRTGKYHVVGVKTTAGPEMATQFRVLPYVFTRSSIAMPPELCEAMHMNHAMWNQLPLETCKQYNITTTNNQSANGVTPFETHPRVAYVMAPDEVDAYDNVGGGYDKGLGYNARLMAHAGWWELVDRFAPNAVTWFNSDGTTRPLNWAVYGQFADITSFDPYPVTFYNSDQAFVRESLAMVRQCSTPNRLFAVVEAFGWPQSFEPGFAEGISGYGRGPVTAEYRQNVVQAIGAGIKGLSSWTYSSGVSGWQLYPSAKAEIAAMNTLIEHIEDDLLLGAPIDLAASDAGVIDTGTVGEEKWPKQRVWVSSLLCGPDTIVLAVANHIPANKPKPPKIDPARNVTITVTLPEYLSQVQAYEATEAGLKAVVTMTVDQRLSLKIESLESGRVFVLRRL